MRKTNASVRDSSPASPTPVATLVMSQHEAVRRQLVTYLARSPSLVVSGDVVSPDEIVRSHPDVLVLDLSQVGREHLRQAIQAALRVGARLVALASIPDPADERAVISAGGLYRLKSAGADGLDELVQSMPGRGIAAVAPGREVR